MDQGLLEELLTSGEVVVDERGGSAGSLGDPRDSHLVDAVGRDQVAGGVKDALRSALRPRFDVRGHRARS